MNIRNIHTVLYSPTGTSARVARTAAAACAASLPQEVFCGETDFTHQAPDGPLLLQDTLAFVAAPVYGGRIAETAAARLRHLRGERSAAVAVALYGNRDYEDALLELADLLEAGGFSVIAAAAFVGEHSYSRPQMPIAAGRPDERDLEQAADLGREVAGLLAASGAALPRPAIPGNRPYKVKGTPTPQAPVCDGSVCLRCGVCADGCPVGAVEITRTGAFCDPARCTKCCACVKACPAGALRFDTPYTEMLFRNFSARREPELFLPGGGLFRPEKEQG